LCPALPAIREDAAALVAAALVGNFSVKAALVALEVPVAVLEEKAAEEECLEDAEDWAVKP
jgi:hypothetical protein